MNIKKVIKIESYFSIIGAIGLIIWWFMMPLFLPIEEATTNFKNLILDSNWVAVNVVGLISVLLLTVGFSGFFERTDQNISITGVTGKILASIGLILFSSIQYYETLIWPAAAKVNPELVQVNGGLVSGDLNVMVGLIVSGVFLGAGYILFGISQFKDKSLPNLPIWFLIIGAPVFGNGIAFPIRTIGLILFCTGTIWLANISLKTLNK